MQHLQLALSILLLSTGFGGLTVSLIFWFRTRDEALLIVAAETAIFALGLVVSIGVFYMREIAGGPVDLGRIAGYVNGVLVLILYSGLLLLVRRVAEGSMAPAFAIGGLVFLVYLVFAFLGPSVQPIYSFMAEHPGLVTVISVLSASAFLGSSGWYLWRSPVEHASVIQQLIRSIGLTLVLYGALSAVSTLILVSAAIPLELTGVFNFILFVGWNAMLIAAFVRYLVHPADLFADDLPQQAIDRFGISPREADVIRLVSEGLSNKEIADRLNVSFTTVRTHLYNIFKKTGAASRLELLRILSAG